MATKSYLAPDVNSEWMTQQSLRIAGFSADRINKAMDALFGATDEIQEEPDINVEPEDGEDISLAPQFRRWSTQPEFNIPPVTREDFVQAMQMADVYEAREDEYLRD